LVSTTGSPTPVTRSLVDVHSAERGRFRANAGMDSASSHSKASHSCTSPYAAKNALVHSSRTEARRRAMYMATAVHHANDSALASSEKHISPLLLPALAKSQPMNEKVR